VKGRSGAHALSSGPSIGGQELIMKAAAVLDVPELLTTAEVAALLKVNRSTLSRWRSAGAGPRVTWLTANIPRYQRADVVEWLRQATVDHSEAAVREVVRSSQVGPHLCGRQDVRHETRGPSMAYAGAGLTGGRDRSASGPAYSTCAVADLA
jgi:predicted DNA-binding transcriptional regulator AlpA